MVNNYESEVLDLSIRLIEAYCRIIRDHYQQLTDADKIKITDGLNYVSSGLEKLVNDIALRFPKKEEPTNP